MVDEELKKFLSEIKDWVVVVGSRARGQHNDHSDIDMYIKYKNVPYRSHDDADTFIDWIEEKLGEYGYSYKAVDGCILLVTGTPIVLDMSNFFDIDEENDPIFILDVEGVEMSAAIDGIYKESYNVA